METGDELMQALKDELNEVIKAESCIEAEIEESLESLIRLDSTKSATVTDGKQIALQLEGLEKSLYPRFDGLSTKVVGLSEHIYSCQELADKMSCTVRKLDERQMRVQRVLALVEDIINLKTCAEGVARALEEGDLPDATSYVKQFHSIEGAAAKASEHYDFMVQSEAKLKDTVMRRVQNAVSHSNLEDVFKFCPLLGPLGLANEGAKIYESFAERLLKENLDPLASDTKTPVVQLLPRVYNTAAGFLNHHLPLVAHGFKQVDADVSLIHLVQKECERAVIPILRRFIKARSLPEKCRLLASASPPGQSGGGREGPPTDISPELDGLMDELALVIQHTESYDRFVRYLAAEAKKTSKDPNVIVLPSATDLNGAIAEVSGPYTVLENHLMHTSIKKALAIDEAPPLAYGASYGTQTSSCVDDSFYVVRRCARRALVTGHAGTASAIINYINSILTDELLTFLQSKITGVKDLPLPLGGASGAVAGVKQQWTKVKDSLEAGLETANNLTAVAGSVAGAFGTIGGVAFSESDAAQALDRLIMLNNLAACSHYTIKLQQELVAEVPSIFQDDPSTQQLMACLQDLSQTSKHFTQAAEEGVHHIANLIKPKIRSSLSEAVGDRSQVSFDLDEEDFAANEAADPFALRFVEYLGAVLIPISQRLSDRSYEILQQSVAEYLCKRLETIIMKKDFTQLGGLQLDKDLRCIMSFFSSTKSASGGGHAGRGERDRFARLLQISQILNMDRVDDATEALGPGSKLTPEDVVQIFRLRVDYSDSDIDRMAAILLQQHSKR